MHSEESHVTVMLRFTKEKKAPIATPLTFYEEEKKKVTIGGLRVIVQRKNKYVLYRRFIDELRERQAIHTMGSCLFTNILIYRDDAINIEQCVIISQ